MILKSIFLSGLLVGVISCSYYPVSPKVDTRIEIEYTYKMNKKYESSKWRKLRRKTAYERYDKNGNLIEQGTYGEIWYFSKLTRNSDSSITFETGHGRNYKKLNTVHYFEYDSTGAKVHDMLWRFKDNKKSALMYRTVFEYNLKGELVKETEYDHDNLVSRIQDYSYDNTNMILSKDSVSDFSYEHTVRIKGKKENIIKTDSLGRPIEKIYYANNRFLYRQEFRYGLLNESITELRYSDKPDSLWSITEWQYEIFTKKPTRKFWKVIGSTERKDIYIYNRKKLLVKIQHYTGDKLEGFTKYKYRLHR